MTKIALTIAGSDSGGGAGIQADLRTFAMHCVHGASVITCVTAQNTLEVTKVEAITLETISAQIAAVAQDFKIAAVKTGMLLNQQIIEQVAQLLAVWNLPQLVVDPVMVSRSGVRLIDDRAIASLQRFLLPKAVIITPNLYETEILSGMAIASIEDLKQAAIAIQQQLGVTVLAKGGALSGDSKATDVWFDGQEPKILATKIVDTHNTHGTGCTLSAAICANLALGKDLWSAVLAAKQYVTAALEHSLDIGSGYGPVGHFYPFNNPKNILITVK